MSWLGEAKLAELANGLMTWIFFGPTILGRVTHHSTRTRVPFAVADYIEVFYDRTRLHSTLAATQPSGHRVQSLVGLWSGCSNASPRLAGVFESNVHPMP